MGELELRHPADAWVGPGLFKVCYMTNDLDQAVEHWRSRVGIEEFVTFDTAFDVVMADGRSGSITAKIAFSYGRQLLVELVEPVDGLIEFFTAGLDGADGFAVAFHHMGFLVDSIDESKRVAAASGNLPVLESAPGALVPMVFYAPPHLGFFVEHVQDSTGGIRELQRRSLPDGVRGG
jgi:hypothetical protein